MLTFYRSKFKNRVLFDKMAEYNEADLLSHAMAVRSATPNEFGRLYIHGCAMGVERIAEVVECYTILRDRANGGLCWFRMSLRTKVSTTLCTYEI